MVQANLDGSNATILLEWPTVQGLELDELGNRLYWGSFAGIASVDLNLGDIRLLSGVQGIPRDIAMDNDNLYYTIHDRKDVHVISKLGSVSSSATQLTDYPHWNMALFGTRVSSPPPNPCENSECAHLYVLKSASSYGCVCADDEELNSDGKTCRTSANVLPIISEEFRNLMMMIMGGSQLVPTV